MIVQFCCIVWLNVVVCLLSIIICLVPSNIVIEGVMLSLGGCVLFMFFDFVFVVLGVVCRFMSWVGCKSGIPSWGRSLKTLFMLVLHVFHVSKI